MPPSCDPIPRWAAAKHHAKCAAKGDSHSYVLHGRAKRGSQTQTQTDADTDAFDNIPQAKSMPRRQLQNSAIRRTRGVNVNTVDHWSTVAAYALGLWHSPLCASGEPMAGPQTHTL